MIFKNSGFEEVRKYRYWNKDSRGLDFSGMIEDLRAAPEGAVVILHACAHNPTGIDPTHEQVEKRFTFLIFFINLIFKIKFIQKLLFLKELKGE
jgi:aspartate/tyrosine/aromatic aminotransferase